MTYIMFLDDERYPVDESCVVVRSYAEAVGTVMSMGVPKHVDFDHDLGDGPNGYDFAKFLVGVALDGGGFPESYSVHSQNPVGKGNIEGIMEGYISHKG